MTKHDEALRDIICEISDKHLKGCKIKNVPCNSYDRKKCNDKIQQINDLHASEVVLDEAYLSDIIYCATQYLKLPDKDVAILNGRLLKAIAQAGINKLGKE